MNTTAVLSLSWREGGPELLARCTAPSEERPALLAKLAAALHADEVLYLVTCNRVEVAFRGIGPVNTEDSRRALLGALDPGGSLQPKAWRAWIGDGAVEHLFMVAAGLTSAKIGETEIAGQLRDSLSLSRDLGLAGGTLGDFVDEALRCARRVRRETALSDGRTSLAEIALEKIRAHREGVTGAYKIAMIGRSAMTERCARALAPEGVDIHWANRTPAHIEPIAAELGATVHKLQDFQASPPSVHAVVSATGATEAVLGKATLVKLAENGTSLAVDLSVSPDIRAEEATAAGISHLGLEQILIQAEKSRAEKSSSAAEARLLVDDALEQLATRHRARSAGKAASRLHERFRADAAKAADDALGRDFKHLSEDDADRLRRFADLLARRLAHDPAKGLRRLAADHGPTAADDFLNEPKRRQEH